MLLIVYTFSMNKLEIIGFNIKYYRRKAGLAQVDLAIQVGIDRAYLSSIENGHRNPTILILFAIADALQVDICALLTHPDEVR